MERTSRSVTRTLTQGAIIAFCLWHMFAVLVFAVPRDAKDSFAVASRLWLLPVVTPYMYVTSQWQLWNLFAPDPLRRVTTYYIEADRGSGWEPLIDIRPGTFPWWRHAVQFKFLGNVFDPFDAGRDKVKARYMQLQCIPFDLPPGSKLRLSYRYYVIPHPVTPQPVAWWRQYVPQWQSVDGLETSCPDSAS